MVPERRVIESYGEGGAGADRSSVDGRFGVRLQGQGWTWESIRRNVSSGGFCCRRRGDIERPGCHDLGRGDIVVVEGDVVEAGRGCDRVSLGQGIGLEAWGAGGRIRLESVELGRAQGVERDRGGGLEARLGQAHGDMEKGTERVPGFGWSWVSAAGDSLRLLCRDAIQQSKRAARIQPPPGQNLLENIAEMYL